MSIKGYADICYEKAAAMEADHPGRSKSIGRPSRQKSEDLSGKVFSVIICPHVHGRLQKEERLINLPLSAIEEIREVKKHNKTLSPAGTGESVIYLYEPSSRSRASFLSMPPA